MLDMKIIGENIRTERKRQLLTIERLAEIVGITENFLGKIERGESMPSFPTMDSIACALGVSIDFLKGNYHNVYLTPKYICQHSPVHLTNRQTNTMIYIVTTHFLYNHTIRKHSSHISSNSQLSN